MGSNILSSWKEISAYTGFTERTLQRWEQRFGFPVHRPAGRARSAVSALVTEIDAWLRAAPSLPQIQQTLARYPGKLPHQLSQQPLELASPAAESPSLTTPSDDEHPNAPRTGLDSRASLELAEVFVTGLNLMRLMRQERVAMRAHLAMLRAELARTREISMQAWWIFRSRESPFL